MFFELFIWLSDINNYVFVSNSNERYRLTANYSEQVAVAPSSTATYQQCLLKAHFRERDLWRRSNSRVEHGRQDLREWKTETEEEVRHSSGLAKGWRRWEIKYFFLFLFVNYLMVNCLTLYLRWLFEHFLDGYCQYNRMQHNIHWVQ